VFYALFGLKEGLHPFLHIFLVGSLPVDPLALRTLKESLLMMEDIVRDLPVGLLPGDLFQEVVAEETPGEESLVIEGDVSISNDLF